jgi:hypothetical protein
MSYTVTSDLEVCGKIKGDNLTAKDLEAAGADIDALVAAGHIKDSTAPAPFKPATKEGDI